MLQVVRREVSDSKQVSSNIRETKTTVLSPDLNGGLSPVAQIQQRETRTGEHSSQFKKSTLLPDGNGGWQVGEVREGIVQGDGKTQTRDETLLRPDGNGNLSVVERTVTREAETAPGEKRDTVEKYAKDIPGTSADEGLRLSERTTSVQRTSGGGSQTVTANSTSELRESQRWHARYREDHRHRAARQQRLKPRENHYTLSRLERQSQSGVGRYQQER